MIRPVSSVSFKGIYHNSELTFSPEQKEVMDGIVDNLRKPDKRGKTPEKKYKNWDFYFDAEKENKISLTAYHRAKTDKETGKPLLSDFQRRIGIYGKKNPFSISDIKEAMSEYRNMNILFYAMALLTLGMAAATTIVNRRAADHENPKTEQVEMMKNHNQLEKDTVSFYNRQDSVNLK